VRTRTGRRAGARAPEKRFLINHFKRHTGKSFTRFLAAVRLNAACRSLLETDLPVSEVALACGYGNLSYFHRRFRSLYNRSPLAFRREIRKENTKIFPRSGI